MGDGNYTALYPAVVWDALADTADSFRWSGELLSGGRVTPSHTATITGGGNAEFVNVAFG